MDSVIQSRCPRISNSEYFPRLVRVMYTAPLSSISIPTGSGASESEANRVICKPGAILMGNFSLAVFAFSAKLS